MDLELRDTVAVVVGAAQGSGEAVARGFAAEGARVACVDRDGAVAGVALAIGRPTDRDLNLLAAIEHLWDAQVATPAEQQIQRHRS